MDLSLLTPVSSQASDRASCLHRLVTLQTVIITKQKNKQQALGVLLTEQPRSISQMKGLAVVTSAAQRTKFLEKLTPQFLTNFSIDIST